MPSIPSATCGVRRSAERCNDVMSSAVNKPWLGFDAGICLIPRAADTASASLASATAGFSRSYLLRSERSILSTVTDGDRVVLAFG